MPTLEEWRMAVARVKQLDTAVPTLRELRTAVARAKQLDTAKPTLREWRTAVARVQPAAAALDSATRALGIRH